MRYIFALLLSYVPAVAMAATEAHGDAHGAEESGSLPQFNLETFSSQAFWLFVTFFFVYTFVKNMILPQISGTMNKREDHIRHELAEAAILTEKAKILQGEYEARMSEAYKLAQEKYTQARVNITKKLADAETKQRDAFANKRNAFIGSYEAQRSRIIEELNVEAKSLSKMVAEKLTKATEITKTKKAA